MTTALSTFEYPFAQVSWLKDDELAAQVVRLNQHRQVHEAELLLHLSEFDRRGLFRGHACSSLFTYCTERLGFSEDAAYKRVGAARMLRQFPLIFGLLTEGRIHLSALLLLRPHLTECNHSELLLSACGKSKRAVEKLVATLAPRPDAPTRIRKMPDASCSASCATLTTLEAPNGSPMAPEHSTETAAPTLEAPNGSSVAPHDAVAAPSVAVAAAKTVTPQTESSPGGATKIQPLSSCRYRITFTASDGLIQKLERARELSSHAVSPTDLPALVERAFELLILHEEKRRFASNTKHGHNPTNQSRDPRQFRGPRKHRTASPANGGDDSIDQSQDPRRAVDVGPAKRSRYVPAAVRREIWERDQGRCTFVDPEGHRCSERHFLEIEHRVPHAQKGAGTVENCVLLCRSHNALRAEEVFGRARIAARMAQARQ